MPSGTIQRLPLIIHRIQNDISSWYNINEQHFRSQGVSSRYIADRLGETLYQEKSKGKISNYRIMIQSNIIDYWMTDTDGNRFYFNLFLNHLLSRTQSMIDAYDRAMRGV